jgi:ketosteroid isomerase-like protein
VPQENLETVRRFIAHWNEHAEFPTELVDAGIVYTIDPPAWLAGTYRGHAELRELAKRTLEVYDEFRFEVDEFIAAGDSVLALGAAHVRGALSGATAVQTGAAVGRAEGGKVMAIRIYFDRDEAFQAVEPQR